METPRLGNPHLTYNFHTTPQLAIFLNNHHKRPSFCCLLSSILFNFFSLLYPFFPFSLCTLLPPILAAPSIAPQLSIVRLFFSSLNSTTVYTLSLTLLLLIHFSLSSYFYTHCAIYF